MKKLQRFMALGAILASGWTGGLAMAETGSLLRDDTLRAAATTSASEVGKVAKGASLEILTKQGGWLQVRAGNQTGWVRLLSVRRGEAGQGNARAELSGLVAIGTTRSDPNRVTGTLGFRGLGEEDLKLARYNERELQRLLGYAEDKSGAQRFARKRGLEARNVDYLPDPAKVSDREGAPDDGTAPGGGFNLMGGE